MRICITSGCERKHVAQGRCRLHYEMLRRHGILGLALKPTVESRFWSKIDENGPESEHRPDLGPCWLWIAYKDAKGYGNFYANGKKIQAHRYAYERRHEPVPSGMVLDHLCRTPACVRESHLEVVTNQENCLRGIKGRLTTQCPKGHPYDEANTRIQVRGGTRIQRICRICSNAATRDYKRRIKGYGTRGGTTALVIDREE